MKELQLLAFGRVAASSSSKGVSAKSAVSLGSSYLE